MSYGPRLGNPSAFPYSGIGTSMTRPKTIPHGRPTFLLGMEADFNGEHPSEFNVPIDIAVDSTAVLGRKGSGKSHTGRVLAESYARHHIQLVIADPLDVWWGLRASADGKGPGLDIPIFGGSHADLPLNEHAGTYLADLIVNEGISAILVLDELSQSAQRRFMATLIKRMFELKRTKRTPLHLMLDEADVFAPQKPMPDAVPCLHEVDRMVRQGRSRGFGSTCLTQRPAVLSKDVLTQTEMLLAMQVSAPQDRAALKAWIDANASKEEATEFMSSLASMKTGDAYVWSPKVLECFTRIRVRGTETFDSSFTPKIGEALRAPVKLKDLDLAAIKSVMAATIEEAKANDPRELKARIKELERELAGKVKAPTGPTPDEQKVMIDRAVAKAVSAAVKERDQAWQSFVRPIAAGLAQGPSGTSASTVVLDRPPVTNTGIGSFHMGPGSDQRNKLSDGEVVGRLTQQIQRHVDRHTVLGPGQDQDKLTPLLKHLNDRAAAKDPTVAAINAMALSPMSAPHRKILTVLAQHSEHHNSDSMPNERCAIRAGYSYSGGFRNYLSELRGRGWIMNGAGGIFITVDGLKALGPYESLPIGPALLDWWCERTSAPEAKILRCLSGVPTGLGGPAIAANCGYEFSGGFRNYLSSLRTKGLIVGSGKELIRLHEDLT